MGVSEDTVLPDPVSLSRRGTHNWSESTEVPSSSPRAVEPFAFHLATVEPDGVADCLAVSGARIYRASLAALAAFKPQSCNCKRFKQTSW